MHDSASAFNGTETISGQQLLPRSQLSKVLFARQDIAVPFTPPAGYPGGYSGVNQFWMALAFSGSGASSVPNSPEIFNANLGNAETRIIAPTGSHVSVSIDNLVEHINNSSSHADYTPWLTDVSASRHGASELVLHRTKMGNCGNMAVTGGVGWSAFYINYKYFSTLGGIANTSSEAGTGNLSSGNGLMLGANGNQTSVGNISFVSGTLEGSFSASLEFTRSGCFPSNLPQEFNVCYTETLLLGSDLEASSSCCFLLQLNKQPFANSSSSYCQPTFTPVVCLDEVFGPCNYDTLEFNASDLGVFDLSTFADNKPRCQSFTADQSTMANGSVIISMTASAANSDCLNDASGQPSMSQGHNPESVLTPGCCPAFSQSAIIYFNPGLNAGITNVQCYPTMSLAASSIFGTSPTLGAYTWSIAGGNGAPAPHAIPGFNGNVAPDEIYIEGANLLRFNTATSNSFATEVYLNHPTASGLYTASVSIMNGPCEYSASVFVKMVSASANAGPDINYCVEPGHDASLRMDAEGVGIWTVVSPLPPAPQPSIGDLSSPITKIQQDMCSTYVYEWTISSGSMHFINEDTYSVVCNASDQVTVSFNKSLISGSILGIHTASGFGTSHPAITHTRTDGTKVYSNNIFMQNLDGNTPLTFKGMIDPTATEATWSVYMSGSPYEFANSLHAIGTDDALQGIMGEFTPAGTMFWPYLYSGNTLTSQSVGGAAMGQGLAAQNRISIAQGLNPPSIGSHRFNFSSSHSNTWGTVIPYLLEQTSPCICPDSRPRIHGFLTFRPPANDGALQFVLPTLSNPGLFNNNAGAYAPPSAVPARFVYEPVLSMSVPKYDSAVMISFHSGSNWQGPRSQSAVMSKNGQNLHAPYLTFSYDPGTNPPTPPIVPLERKTSITLGVLPEDVDSSAPNPNASAPFWPAHNGPAVKVGTGITSGSGETLSWNWKAREIAVYRNGIILPLAHDGTTIPPTIVTGSFTDTMTSESHVEAPAFFPPHRDPTNAVANWNSSAIGIAVHRPYGNISGYSAIKSCSIMFEVTMSRIDPVSQTPWKTYYASQSAMFVA